MRKSSTIEKKVLLKHCEAVPFLVLTEKYSIFAYGIKNYSYFLCFIYNFPIFAKIR